MKKKSKIALYGGLCLLTASLVMVDQALGLIACGAIAFAYVYDGEVRRMFK